MFGYDVGMEMFITRLVVCPPSRSIRSSTYLLVVGIFLGLWGTLAITSRKSNPSQLPPSPGPASKPNMRDSVGQVTTTFGDAEGSFALHFSGSPRTDSE